MARLRFSLLLLAAACVLGPPPFARAAIVTTGDVKPGSASTWDKYTSATIGDFLSGSVIVDLGSHITSFSARIGNYGTGVVTLNGNGSAWTNAGGLGIGSSRGGTLNITGGATVTCSSSYVANDAPGTGVVNVEGTGSLWNAGTYLYISTLGTGTLNIASGGAVSVGHATYVANGPGTGVINFGPGGGTLTTRTLFATPKDLVGTGTIVARGLVSDLALVFDASTGLKQAILLESQPNQHVMLDLDMTNGTTELGHLGAGWRGEGSLTIRDGVKAASSEGFLGYQSKAKGVASVIGPGSTWTTAQAQFIGFYGSGELAIQGGGSVAPPSGYIGYNAGSSGVVSVEGANSAWTSTGELYVGYWGAALLQINDGATVACGSATIGQFSKAIGTVTVDGVGSRLTTNGGLTIGVEGSGALSILRGGAVIVGGTTRLGSSMQSTALLTFVDGGGTLTTRSLVASPNHFLGTGTIATRGLVSDVNLVFDSVTNLRQVVTFRNQLDDIVTVNLDMAGTTTENGDCGVGLRANGSLVVRNVALSSIRGYLGYYAGSSGVATITGSESKWISSGLSVGEWGNGKLQIEAGGEVRSGYGEIGYLNGSAGVVCITGIGSTWINTYSLRVGQSGGGTVVIADGGSAAAKSVSINSKSIVTIDVANDSKLTVNNGTGTITNNGKIRLLAGPGPNAGVAYAPISAGDYGNSANYQAVGGTWDATGHTFTPSVVQPAAGGASVELDLATQQRAMVNDSATGWAIGESFLAKSASLTVTTTAIIGATQTSLEQALDPSQSLRGGWQFATSNGYAAGDPAYLSFDLGGGYSRSALAVWRYDGSAWTSYDAVDLTYDGRYASFTVTELNGLSYAMVSTQPVPEPATWTLLGIALVGALTNRYRRRVRKDA